ncbi:MAG: thermonuclease family protein [Eubacteriales bacterium]|nr:thermonuclease family protein [Eubacteriales bacterium]
MRGKTRRAAVLILILFHLSGCAVPGSTTSVAADHLAIGDIGTWHLGRRVTVKGRLTWIRRLDQGGIQCDVQDDSGTIRVFADPSLQMDGYRLALDQDCQLTGQVRLFRGQLEIQPDSEADLLLPGPYRFEPVEVVRVIDGDTVRVQNASGERLTVRIIGIDCPELDGEPFAEEARRRAEELVLNQTVFLERDNGGEDRYGRLLRYVWLNVPDVIDDASIRSQNVSAVLLLEGLARAAAYSDNTKYAPVFEALDHEAQTAGRGFWRDGKKPADLLPICHFGTTETGKNWQIFSFICLLGLLN